MQNCVCAEVGNTITCCIKHVCRLPFFFLSKFKNKAESLLTLLSKPRDPRTVLLKSQQKREACVEPGLSRSARELSGLGRARRRNAPGSGLRSLGAGDGPAAQPGGRVLASAVSPRARPGVLRECRLYLLRSVPSRSPNRRAPGRSFSLAGPERDFLLQVRFSLKLLRCTGPGEHPVLL